ncbi:metallophosphoesterase [Helicobacter sp. MIT 21-1697]|uniref:metallophosphoesterase n=1 Tax=Helicobacter sp. MIT 21-1697 TaxID=2993733 RepID=UPI00224AB0E4|nr:metallophosphoesterase [Helicobacter sp. MIT 21-1697]MCX2716192.1 metallophosphoesterase [Helicobacter sp. MIT 21-1697]
MNLAQKDVAKIWEEAPYINNDAVFIADAHFISPDFPSLSQQSISASHALLTYFDTLLNNPDQMPSQIFLMGDIAHLLLGSAKSSQKSNASLLQYIESLSRYTQVWWFEGNHDFGLSALQKAKTPFLKNVKCIPRSNQPLAFNYQHNQKEKKILLAHGDIFLNTKYELYIRLMTSTIMQFLIKYLDKITFGNLYKYIITKINHKPIKEGKIDISHFAPTRIYAYESYLKNINACAFDTHSCLCSDILFIEGHFHIGKTYTDKTLYISLPSFYITRSIFSIESILSSNHIQGV